MPTTSPWKLPPGPERRERLRLLDVSITAEDYTAEELAALRMAPAGDASLDPQVTRLVGDGVDVAHLGPA